jgi:hypothetical protein
LSRRLGALAARLESSEDPADEFAETVETADADELMRLIDAEIGDS